MSPAALATGRHEDEEPRTWRARLADWLRATGARIAAQPVLLRPPLFGRPEASDSKAFDGAPRSLHKASDDDGTLIRREKPWRWI